MDGEEGTDVAAVEVTVRKDAEGGFEETVVEVIEPDGVDVVMVVDEEHREPLPVVIEVNRKPVSMDARRATGEQIKSSAIAQGVEIHLDFVLAVRRDGRTDPVRNDQEVRLHRGECFVANAADDNS
jgi:Multiubiquitin